jgi:predicted transcriptional regulator
MLDWIEMIAEVNRRKNLECQSKEELFRKMYESGMSILKIADTLGIHHGNVSYYFKKYNIPTRPPVKEIIRKELKEGTSIELVHKNNFVSLSYVKKLKRTI